jgi:hypothetical protein
MRPATYNMTPLVRGDTMPAWTVVFTQDSAPVAIDSARLQLREPGKVPRVVYEWMSTGASPNITIGGMGLNELTFAPIASSDSAGFPVGTLEYDLEVVLPSGVKWTPISGTLQILRDITRS